MYKIVALCLGFFVLICGTSCVSTTRYGTDDTILDYQRKIVELETTINGYEHAVRENIECIDRNIQQIEELGTRTSEFTGTIDEIITRFENYESAVERLLHDYREIRSRLEQCSQESTPADSNSFPADNSSDSTLVY